MSFSLPRVRIAVLVGGFIESGHRVASAHGGGFVGTPPRPPAPPPDSKPPLTRAPACAGLGLLADPERVPSLSLLGIDSNYLARTEALHEALSLL